MIEDQPTTTSITTTTTAAASLERQQKKDKDVVTPNENVGAVANPQSKPAWLREDCLEFYRNELLNQAIPAKNRVGLLRLGINRAMAVKKLFPRAQFLEFGVHEGKDLVRMATFLNSVEKQSKSSVNNCSSIFHGFDSFEGLPEDWINGQLDGNNQLVHKKGAFDTGGKAPQVDGLRLQLRDYGLGHQSSVADKIVFHKGWFHETLPPFLEDHNSPVAFVHADADLYTSTLTVLQELCERKLLRKGTVIIFDEFWNYPHWQEGEFKAWTEIVEVFGLHYKHFGYHAPTSSAKIFKRFGYQSVGVVITSDMK